MTLFGCCSDVSEGLLRAKRRDWERSKERSTTAPPHHGRFLHRVREARGLNRSSFVVQQQADHHKFKGGQVRANLERAASLFLTPSGCNFEVPTAEPPTTA